MGRKPEFTASINGGGYTVAIANKDRTFHMSHSFTSYAAAEAWAEEQLEKLNSGYTAAEALKLRRGN